MSIGSGSSSLHAWISGRGSLPITAVDAGVWAVYPKSSSGLSDLTWDALVEECLCFGWIDSLPGKVDAQRTRTYISPRKPGSGWSRRNQNLVEILVEQGRMHEAGAAVVAAAKADGSWELFDLAEDLVIPQNSKRNLQATRKFAPFSTLPKAHTEVALAVVLLRED